MLTHMAVIFDRTIANGFTVAARSTRSTISAGILQARQPATVTAGRRLHIGLAKFARIMWQTFAHLDAV